MPVVFEGVLVFFVSLKNSGAALKKVVCSRKINVTLR
jgi:hypothetical protein